MTNRPDSRMAASIRARLKNVADQRGEDFGQILVRYGIERLLYRLSRSSHRDRFVLKGAALFMAWGGEPHRPTRDVDLLGFGASDMVSVEAALRAIALTPVEDDGLNFPIEMIRGGLIKEGQRYEGVRITLIALLERARIPLLAAI